LAVAGGGEAGGEVASGDAGVFFTFTFTFTFTFAFAFAFAFAFTFAFAFAFTFAAGIDAEAVGADEVAAVVVVVAGAGEVAKVWIGRQLRRQNRIDVTVRANAGSTPPSAPRSKTSMGIRPSPTFGAASTLEGGESCEATKQRANTEIIGRSRQQAVKNGSAFFTACEIFSGPRRRRGPILIYQGVEKRPKAAFFSSLIAGFRMGARRHAGSLRAAAAWLCVFLRHVRFISTWRLVSG
jgi:hypothetical protein